MLGTCGVKLPSNIAITINLGRYADWEIYSDDVVTENCTLCREMSIVCEYLIH